MEVSINSDQLEAFVFISQITHFLLRLMCFLFGFLTIRLGYKLILSGAKGEFKFGGEMLGFKSHLQSFSPGLLFVLLGSALIIYGLAVNKEIRIDSMKASKKETTPIMHIPELLNDTL